MQGAVGTGGGRIGSQQRTGLPETVAMVAFGCGLQSFVSHLMGHFVEQHLLDVIPATVVDDIPAQGDLPFGRAPAAQPARHIPNGEDGFFNRLPKRIGQQPEGIFPFRQQAAQDLAIKRRPSTRASCAAGGSSHKNCCLNRSAMGGQTILGARRPAANRSGRCWPRWLSPGSWTPAKGLSGRLQATAASATIWLSVRKWCARNPHCRRWRCLPRTHPRRIGRCGRWYRHSHRRRSGSGWTGPVHGSSS